MHALVAIAVLLVTTLVPAAPGPADTAWPQFRGPSGRAISAVETLPTKWSTTINVAWKADVPGRGWSSPIVWGDQVIVTSAVGSGAFKQPSPGIYGNDYVADLQKQGLSDDQIMEKLRQRDLESPQEAGELRFMLYSFDIKTGQVRWSREAHKGPPIGGRHRKNTYASETPATDGERIYALFGNIGLFCYSMDGALLWSHPIPPQPRYLDFGTAASPVVHDGRVYFQDDNEVDSYLAALDAKTGAVIWKTPRTAGGGRPLSGWSSPYVWVNAKRTEIVTIGRQLAVSYDLEGKELWRLKGLTQANPTPIEGDGLLYLGTGSQGESNRPLFAVRPGASGDISLKPDETGNAFVAWFQPRAAAYTSSPLVFGGRVYAVNDTGVLQVFDAKTGREIYKARVGGVGNTFSASPWAAGGKIFFLSEEGDTFVVNPGDSYDEIAKNSLGELAFASPAVTRDGLFVRTQSKLYRISEANLMRATVLLSALLLAGCGGSSMPATTTQPTAAVPAPPAAPPTPTSWAVSGQILSAPAGAPIPGASIAFGDAAPLTADSGGNYSLVTTDTAIRPLLVTAPGFFTRETSLAGGAARTGVLFDLIGNDPVFPRAQYLDEARNAYEQPGRHEPTRRWTANPNVYVSTVWRDTGVPVAPESIAFLVGEIRRVIPLWTSGQFQAGLIETGPGARPLTKGWISVEFGRSGNWSRLGEDPGQVQFGSEGTCVSLAILHEFGHALGYWHTAVRPSVMGGAPGSCTLAELTANEKLIAKLMYPRDPGNLEPDKDGPPPPPPAYLHPSIAGAPDRSAYRVLCDALLLR